MEKLLLFPALFVLHTVSNFFHTNFYFQNLEYLKFFNEWNFLIKLLTLSQRFIKSKNFRRNIESCYSLFYNIFWKAKHFIIDKMSLYKTYLFMKYLFAWTIDLLKFQTILNATWFFDCILEFRENLFKNFFIVFLCFWFQFTCCEINESVDIFLSIFVYIFYILLYISSTFL